MELCGPRQNIDIRDLLQSYHNSKAATHEILHQVSSTKIQPHHSSIHALQDAARTGYAEIPAEDTPLLEGLPRNKLPFDLRSERCLSLAAEWLRKCYKGHKECDKREDKPPFFPTSVIDVGSSLKRPHLHVSSVGETGRWVALSYCWGGDSRFTLNASGRSLKLFPSTLRDAVLVTRALGVRYLWIDSLCIFQDDSSDWEAEASKMSSVYRHAAVTIAATSAESANDGFLDKRAPYFSCTFPWRRRYYQGSGSVNDDSRADPVVFRSYRRPFHREPLRHSRWATRGWTLQEELLSRRLLYYTKEEMVWRCRAGRAREPARDVNGYDTEFPEPQLFIPDEPDDKHTPGSTRSAYKTWFKLLEDYAARNLTFEKDRLPAIGALAESFHAHLKEQYCAGLWRGDLLFGLLWSIRHCQGSGRPAPTSVPSIERGPSWSWIGAHAYISLKWPSPGARSFMTYLARVVHCQVYRKSHDIFGHVEGAELVLEAPYRHVCLRPGSYSKFRWEPVKSTRELTQIALMRPEHLKSTETSSSVIFPSSSVEFTLIQVAKVTGVLRPRLYLLILQPHTRTEANSGGLHRYRRVGLLRLQPEIEDCWSDEPSHAVSVERISTRRLEDAAYWEVIREEWPVGSFLIE
ncbi:HET-domain-containing protein [Aspergillus eucalypticola CBS 122712]|uniref:HET-domain-containing protein n=1 Tax=Aspergillus eucalypticola (strain CBS 122712 / IBT 29274) TaxID=1448314 RepID=A0A317VEQ6_ASPEC|nr:HET-domain-containing protein [Aspergillus eucalypticola CBS 122712]PWY72844.1 HET-domain-containing protein [Aspergillus eucalypticola CBS 122712]